jgi:riboflavin synthase
MFTGLIERIGTIVQAVPQPTGRRLSVDVGHEWAGEAIYGQSICVEGVCLTVSEIAPPVLSFDVVQETVARSTLSDLAPGMRVNLERSLRVGDRLDGHFVQGHVDGVGRVQEVAHHPEWRLTVAAEPDVMRYIVPKGSVAVAGVSLTIAELGRGCFSVALVPTTLAETTLADRTAGSTVNLETDIVVRSVLHHLERESATSAVTMDTLRSAGFLQ